VRAVSFYHKETGQLAGNHMIVSDNEMLVLNTPPDHIAIDGHHDHLSKRVNIETKEIVDYQPPQPSDAHEWNDSTKRWQLNSISQEKLDKRNSALQAIAILEMRQPRMLREIALQSPGWMTAKADLIEIENMIIELRKDL
jgi:hypothetical protein